MLLPQRYKERFLEKINDDLNMPKALALVWKLVKDKEVKAEEKYALLLGFDKVLGLKLDEVEEVEVPQRILDLLARREKARQEKNFKKADEIRKQIEKMGFEIEDTKDGPKPTSPK